jgi:hypothetical protein
VKKSVAFAICTLVPILAGVSWAHDGDNHHRDTVVVRPFAAVEFAKLPSAVKFPEGITANPHNGDIYVSTFDARDPASIRNNKLLRFDRHGRLEATLNFGEMPLLGLAFEHGQVYIANFGASKIQRVPANFGPSTPVEDVATLPGIGAPGPRTVGNPDGSMDTITFGSNNFPAPNAMVFNRAGDVLFVSDSFQGAIFRIDGACGTPCVAVTVAHDPLLATAGFPPFGANGLALSKDESTLFVANTGDDTILKVDLPSGPVEQTPFAQSINGADGLTRDHHGNLWVAANQADNIVALDRNGRLLAQLGAFNGIHSNGTPNGLLFPASLVIVGDDIFVTNLALPLTGTPDEWEQEVTRYTISRIKIPGSLR